MRQVNVAIWASDEVTHAGLASLLGTEKDINVVTKNDASDVDVMVIGTDGAELAMADPARRESLQKQVSIVLVPGDITDEEVARAISLDVLAVIPRTEATARRLSAAVMAVADGHGVLPPDLLGPLLKRFKVTQSRQKTLLNAELGIESRDSEVLRLLADGLDTAHIAKVLFCSERTVKYSLQKVIRALGARNRAHAIASAIRRGLI